MKRLLGLLGVGLLAFASTARAETPPSAWDRAKAPEVGDEYQLHLTVQRMRKAEIDEPDLPNLLASSEGMKLRVLAMLQAAGAEKSNNPLLRFDLADAYMDVNEFPRAAATYKEAMRLFPDHPRARASRFQLALACGHTGDHECEERMYRQVIAGATAPAEITTPMLNLAETEMHARDLREAIEDYREAFRLCGFYPSRAETPALILWGLAVALDRAGELHEADEQAHRALEMMQNSITLLRSTGVFFFPDYEVNWYEALTFASVARREQRPASRLSMWLQAERHMVLWVTGAEKKKDYWLPIGKARLATYEKARKEAERAQAKAPIAEDEEVLSPPTFAPPPFAPPRAPVQRPVRPAPTPPPQLPKAGDVHR